MPEMYMPCNVHKKVMHYFGWLMLHLNGWDSSRVQYVGSCFATYLFSLEENICEVDPTINDEKFVKSHCVHIAVLETEK